MTPAEHFRSPDALRAWQLIEAAQIPPEPSFNTFAAWETNDAYNAANRLYRYQQAERRVRIRNVAAEIAREWPQPFTRALLCSELSSYVLFRPQWRDVKEVFDAAREEAKNLQESK